MAAPRSRGHGSVLDAAALDGAVARASLRARPAASFDSRPGAVAVGAAGGRVSRGAGVAVSREQALRERAVAEMQRSRLLGAAVRVLEEQGYEHATVAHITGRARVSRRTFYELFANREQCIAAVLVDTADQIEAELVAAELEHGAWRERVCVGLWVILSFLEREPELARVLVVHALRGSGPVLKARDEIVGRLVAVVDEGRTQSARAAQCSELTAEGVVGATLAILYRRLAGVPPSGSLRLTGLLGELSATVLLPYLGRTAARRELTRPAPARALRVAAAREPGAGEDPLQGLSMRLTYRTARVLEGVARYPGASNRQLADYAGIQDQGQVSKLLSRLQGLGLLSNQSAGRAKGEPNRWSLTGRGALVAESIALHTASEATRGG